MTTMARRRLLTHIASALTPARAHCNTARQRMETGVVLLVVLFITYVLLICSDGILRVIGRQGASVLVRVMGLILCSLAVEIVLTALGVGPWAAARH
jgi:multiple antibiotic resistance protein